MPWRGSRQPPHYPLSTMGTVHFDLLAQRFLDVDERPGWTATRGASGLDCSQFRRRGAQMAFNSGGTTFAAFRMGRRWQQTTVADVACREGTAAAGKARETSGAAVRRTGQADSGRPLNQGHDLRPEGRQVIMLTTKTSRGLSANAGGKS